MEETEAQEIDIETPTKDIFIPPSISESLILACQSYTHHSALPSALTTNANTPCVLGVDEAGRGPVLGPMVYGLLYVPITQETRLLKQTHGFMDSKVLTPPMRSLLMQRICSSAPDLFDNCGWATRVMSARDIGAGMLHPTRTYNLNAQAMDATIQLIQEVFMKGVNVQEIYIDTIGQPKTYQDRLCRVFPATKITVAKKADSLYPCVSAASVVAKVTRDAALEVLYKAYDGAAGEGWGSGYPSDKRCTDWLRGNMDEVFGWGSECRFSWGTAKEMLEKGGKRIQWPEEEEEEEQGMKVTDFFVGAGGDGAKEDGDELINWFGRPAPAAVF